MDTDLFDNLSKRVFGAISRRAALRGLTATTGAAIVAALGGSLPFAAELDAAKKNHNKPKGCKNSQQCAQPLNPCQEAVCTKRGKKKRKCVTQDRPDGADCGNAATCQSGTCVCPTGGCVITVQPSDMMGWQFYNDQADQKIAPDMVAGPGDPPLGDGSARLQVTNTEGKLLSANILLGTRLEDFQTLSYTFWVTSATSQTGPSLQLGVTRRRGDTSFQGRLVYVPSATENIPTGQWITRNVLANNGAGNWFFSRSNQNWDGKCPLADPCNFNEVLDLFPNIAIHTIGEAGTGAGLGLIGFKVGSGEGNVDANVDSVTIAVAGMGAATTYNFEPDPQ